MARRPLIAANWKMHKTVQEAKSFVAALLPKIAAVRDRDVLICPPFPLIHAVDQARRDTPILLGAQNMYFADSGAFTGEVSGPMLKDLHCEFVILGHSERRWVFGETDELINKKVLAAITHGLIPILCVGEKIEEREQNLTEQVILNQLDLGIKNVPENVIGTMVIAYEPVWAIGTGRNASAKDAHDAIALIREFIHSRFGSGAADKLRILYGGSVKPENMATYMREEGIDGALVGGASLDPESFAKLVTY
ncbi:MAG: Triosephosphate isomerase [Candidatus Ozemobacter sibiricus]|jgi:triosephosphate isomerase|uniref:Triosephosphate isomerase n=1 Tax=Candidatus Ozemobacter sibiricus TaxID=2268124 RepID=A0A367ZUI0_9BACT|nr:MAG: Triosephosphate isomerase [Candidatus Ozemobacter sibiricus]